MDVSIHAGFAEATDLVERIRGIVARIEDRVDDLDLGSRHVHTVTESDRTYLPEILATYRRIPPSIAATQIIDPATGRTHLQVLLDQLRVMEAGLAGIEQAIYLGDGQLQLQLEELLIDKFKEKPTMIAAALPRIQPTVPAPRSQRRTVLIAVGAAVSGAVLALLATMAINTVQATGAGGRDQFDKRPCGFCYELSEIPAKDFAQNQNQTWLKPPVDEASS